MDDNKDILKKFVRYTSMPFEFFVLMGAGAFLGHKIDAKVQTSFPYYTLIFAILGFAVALYHTFKTLKNDK